MINIEQVRADTPGCNKGIFFNSAGASLVTDQVAKTVQEYLGAEQLIGGYKLESVRQDQLNTFYSASAQLLNTKPHNVAFAYNSTFAYGQVLSSIGFEAGEVIITTDDDYVSNYLQFISLEKRYGIKIVRMANMPNGDLDLTNFEELIKKHKPRLVAVTHIPTSSGLIQDVIGVGQICKKYDTIYLVDACQSLGQLVVDVQEIGCDFLAATGRKFLRGPRGTGLLYVSDRMLSIDKGPMQVDAHSANWVSDDSLEYVPTAKRFELFEQPMALKAGLAAAINHLNELGVNNVEQYNLSLSTKLRAGLESLDRVACLDRGSRKASIVTFLKTGITLANLQQHLDRELISYSVARKESARIDFEKKGLDWSIRLSPHYFNTESEVETVLQVVDQL